MRDPSVRHGDGEEEIAHRKCQDYQPPQPRNATTEAPTIDTRLMPSTVVESASSDKAYAGNEIARSGAWAW